MVRFEFETRAPFKMYLTKYRSYKLHILKVSYMYTLPNGWFKSTERLIGKSVDTFKRVYHVFTCIQFCVKPQTK